MSHKEKSLNERIRTFISLIFGLALGSVLLFGESGWENNHIIEESLMLFACIFASIGAFGRVWCSLYIAGYKNEKLVQDGPYSMTRNPLYFFSFIGAVGVGLATESFSIPTLIAIVFALYYPTIIKKESLRLTEIFGDEYRNYCVRVPLFFPKVSLLNNQLTSYTVNPKIFIRSIFDAFWFIWFIGICEFIGGLHQAGVLPVYFKIF